MKISFSLFPKFFKHLDVKGLASLVREVGLDTTNLVIRDGYWVTGERLADEAPRFVEAMRGEGLEVRFATSGFAFDEIAADPTPLEVLAGCGVTDFRPGYFRKVKGEARSVRELLDAARATMERVARVCEDTGTRCVYQLHHGTLTPGPSAIWPIVKGLPAKAVGVMLDPGNQAFEGHEKWPRSCELLGEYVAAAGIKDSAVARDEPKVGDPAKGWRRYWVPCDEGTTDWYDFVRALKGIGFEGTFVFMPFYTNGKSGDGDDPDAMTRKLKREVAYVRKVVTEIAAEG